MKWFTALPAIHGSSLDKTRLLIGRLHSRTGTRRRSSPPIPDPGCDRKNDVSQRLQTSQFADLRHWQEQWLSFA